MGRQRCESVEDLTGEPCPCYASWVIHVGARTYDRQHACGRHLHSACRAITAAEGRSGLQLTIYPV